MFCRKIIKSKTPHFVFCISREDLFKDRKDRSTYLGKLKKTRDTNYVLYGIGERPPLPRRSDEMKNDEEDEQKVPFDPSVTRTELCTISYDNPSFKSTLFAELKLASDEGNAPTTEYLREDDTGRRLEVSIPVPPPYSFDHPCCPPEPEGNPVLSHMTDIIRGQGGQNVVDENRVRFFQTFTSQYDAISTLVVLFQGRASINSPKNVQLIQSAPENPSFKSQYYGPQGKGFWDIPEQATSSSQRRAGRGTQTEEAQYPVFFQMGKVIKDCYNVDFMSPLSPLQAFAIAITRFDLF
jgi:hypothetical protein